MVAPFFSVYGLDVMVECAFHCGGWRGLPRLGVADSCAVVVLGSLAPGESVVFPTEPPPPLVPKGGVCNLGDGGWWGAELIFPGAQDALIVWRERPVRVTDATVGFGHAFEVVTETEQAAVIGLWHWCACCLLCLIHGLPKSEPRSDLEVGECCCILYRHL